MKILILGSSGLLGNYLNKFLSKRFKVFNNGLRKRKVNLLNTSELDKLLLKVRPNLIINCTANTNIDNCEFEKKNAINTNFITLKNTVNLVKKNKLNSKFIQISTDQFYNNKIQKFNRESVNNIPNYYCKTKFFLEKFCVKNKIIVVRTNFFGATGSKNKSFTDWIYKSFRSKKKFYLFNDVYFSPLNLNTLSKMLIKVIQNIDKSRGVYNLGSRDCITKKDFAIYFAKKLKIYNNNYQSVNSKRFFNVKRPNYMCMNIKKFEKKFKVKMPSVYDQINKEISNYKLKK